MFIDDFYVVVVNDESSRGSYLFELNYTPQCQGETPTQQVAENLKFRTFHKSALYHGETNQATHSRTGPYRRGGI